MFDRRINIFTGHFGSGKTEVAVNFALELSKLGYKTAIVDFDIVNPFFRTSDVKMLLEKKNIRVVMPVYAGTNVDVPALPAEINTVFEKKEYKVVFDVGGDDLGARVLSLYMDEILQDDYELFFVINTRRPMTNTKAGIEEMIHDIERSSGLKITGLVNNTNLLQNTVPEDIMEGYELIERVSRELEIPISFTSGFHQPIHQLENKMDSRILCMEKLIKLPWDQ